MPQKEFAANEGKYMAPYSLIVLVSNVLVSVKYLMIDQHAWGLAAYDYHTGGRYVILTCACSIFIQSEFGAWVMSHELSHISLYHKGYPQKVHTEWVHATQEKWSDCNDTSRCKELWTQLNIDSKTFKVMKPYRG